VTALPIAFPSGSDALREHREPKQIGGGPQDPAGCDPKAETPERTAQRWRARTQTKWRFANARPEPVFRYVSNATALDWFANSTETINRQGRLRAVCCDPPEL
jgi:hypothetical protein